MADANTSQPNTGVLNLYLIVFVKYYTVIINVNNSWANVENVFRFIEVNKITESETTYR